jgi:hypothetical protein
LGRNKNWIKHKYLTTRLYSAIKNDAREIFNAMEKVGKVVKKKKSRYNVISVCKKICIKTVDENK